MFIIVSVGGQQRDDVRVLELMEKPDGSHFLCKLNPVRIGSLILSAFNSFLDYTDCILLVV